MGNSIMIVGKLFQTNLGHMVFGLLSPITILLNYL